MVATTNPTARMMNPYSGALSDILQPTDQLPQVEGATHAPTIEHCKATVSVRSILARIFPKLGIDLKQIGSKMFAEPQKLSRGTLAGVSTASAKGGPSGLPALSPAERTAAPISWAATGSVCASMYLGNVVGLVLVLTTVPIFASILRVPFAAVAPMIVVSCAIGACAIQNAMFDIWLMLSKFPSHSFDAPCRNPELP